MIIKKSSLANTEAGSYLCAVIYAVAQVLVLVDNDSIRTLIKAVLEGHSYTGSIFVVLVSFFPSILAIGYLLNGIKLTLKRRAEGKKQVSSVQAVTTDGHVYCPKCGCKLFGDTEICPFCETDLTNIHTAEAPKTVPVVTQTKGKLGILALILFISAICIIAVSIISTIDFGPAGYHNMNTAELHRRLEADMLSASFNSMNDIEEMIKELEVREDSEAEALRNEFEEVEDFIESLYTVGFPATNKEGEELRNTIAEIILFDEKNERWDLSEETKGFMDSYTKELLIGTRWEAGKYYFAYFYTQSGKRVMIQNLTSGIIPSGKTFNSKVTYTGNGKVDVFYVNVEDSEEEYHLFTVMDIYQDSTEKDNWVIEIYVPSNDHVHIMTSTGEIE
jgi:hypothetical protein